MITVLDPGFEADAERLVLAPRPGLLRGATVGIVSNGKAGTKPFFAHLGRILRDEWGVAEVVVRTKANYSAPAETELLDEAVRWAVVFTGVGD
ncbi:MAG: hypothetical protein ACKO91_01970 [Acidimicrobiales bacterium]